MHKHRWFQVLHTPKLKALKSRENVKNNSNFTNCVEKKMFQAFYRKLLETKKKRKEQQTDSHFKRADVSVRFITSKWHCTTSTHTQNSPITKNDMQMQNDAVYNSIMICIQFKRQQHGVCVWPFSFCPILFIHISLKRICCAHSVSKYFFIRSTINEFANYPFE